MPLYEFKCQDCDLVFEELCPIGTTSKPCPGCLSQNTIRKISGFLTKSSGTRDAGTTYGGGCASCKGGNCSSCR